MRKPMLHSVRPSTAQPPATLGSAQSLAWVRGRTWCVTVPPPSLDLYQSDRSGGYSITSLYKQSESPVSVYLGHKRS